MPKMKSVLMGAFGLAALGAVGIAGQYPLIEALKDQTSFTVNEIDPACEANVSSLFSTCSVTTNEGPFIIGNVFTDLHSEDRLDLYNKLAQGKSYDVVYVPTTSGNVILTLTPKS